jgi:CspA family cold shock protein
MSDTQKSEKFIGKVKWFNNKSGFGFITVSTPGDFQGKDIFSHYSAILVDNQYKYLVQGEYVEFDISTTTNGEHEHQASNITGILGGDTMCETRRINQLLDRPRKEKENKESLDVEPSSSVSPEEEGEGFTNVVSKKRASKASADKKRPVRRNKAA